LNHEGHEEKPEKKESGDRSQAVRRQKQFTVDSLRSTVHILPDETIGTLPNILQKSEEKEMPKMS